MTKLTYIAPVPKKPGDILDRQQATLRRELLKTFGNLNSYKAPFNGKLRYFDVNVPPQKVGQELQIFQRLCCFHATIAGLKSAVFHIGERGQVSIINLDYAKEAA